MVESYRLQSRASKIAEYTVHLRQEGTSVLLGGRKGRVLRNRKEYVDFLLCRLLVPTALRITSFINYMLLYILFLVV